MGRACFSRSTKESTRCTLAFSLAITTVVEGAIGLTGVSTSGILECFGGLNEVTFGGPHEEQGYCFIVVCFHVIHERADSMGM